MTAPIAVDPSALAATGTTVSGEGDAAATATETLSSALSGAGGLFGHDAAGAVFAQGYTQSGKALLDAAAAAVNACRRVGFGVQVSASNYGSANAASTVGGGESPVPAPAEHPCFGAPAMPPPSGGGIAAPIGWTLVEGMIGDVWPDGNPAQMHAAAAAWRGFAAAMSAAAGPVSGTGTALGGQQIPEAPKMVDAVGRIGSGLSNIATQAKALASHVDSFADTVQAAQDAVRDLLHQLSPTGVLETLGGMLTGHNPIEKIKQIAGEIKTVLNNMKREADAKNQLFSQGINMLDSATDSLEGWARKEFVSVLGKDVGNVLADDWAAAVDLPEGALKFVGVTAQGLEQLNPARFAYDPDGATKTWKGLADTASMLTNPAQLVDKVISDPKGSLNTVKGLVDWDDVENGHPFRAGGYNIAQLGSLAIPGAGEAAPAADAASAEARVAAASAEAETRAGSTAARDAGAAAATRAAGATEGITTKAGDIGSKLDKVGVPEGAAPGATAPGGRAPVEPPVPSEAPRAEPVPRAPEPTATHSEPPVAAEPHTPVEPHASAPTEPHTPAPHGGDAPAAPRTPEPAPYGAEAPTAPAAEPHVPAASAPHAVPHPVEAPTVPNAPDIPSAREGLAAPQAIEHSAAPSQELASVGAESHGAESPAAAHPGAAHPPEPPPPHDPGGSSGGSTGDGYSGSDHGGDAGDHGGGGGDHGSTDGHGDGADVAADSGDYSPRAPEVASDLNDAFVNGHPTADLAREVADLSTHHMPSPTNDISNADRVVLGKWDGQDGGYIGEARHHGGIYFDTGDATWHAVEHGLDEAQGRTLGWQINEQFLRTQMEDHVPRIEYVLPDGFSSVDEVARVRKESFSALEINYLNDNAAKFGYQRVGNSWVYQGGK